jgi:hypothetical protein
MQNTLVSMRVAGLALAAALGAAGPVRAQEPPLLLLLDRSAIDYGPDPHAIPAQAANVDIADIGLRDQLPYFAARVATSVTLPGGAAESPGWFAVRTVPGGWASDAGLTDGLDNFFVAGPGLGSPDAAGQRASGLIAVPEVAALSAFDLAALAGRHVCAVVFAGEVVPGATTDLSGPTLGTIAFSVTGSTDSGTPWPSLTVDVLDVRQTCGGALVTAGVTPSP